MNTKAEFQITESFFHSVIDAIGHDVLIISNIGKIMYMNIKSQSNLFRNYSNEKINHIKPLMEDFIKRYRVEEPDLILELIDETLNSITFITSEFKIKLIKNGEKHYELSTNPIYDSKLGHLGRIWQFRDITISEKIDEMKSEFLSLASHQLRTPLTSIRGYTDMVLNKDFGDFPKDLEEPLQAVEEAAISMNDLIDDLLNISRLERGIHDVKPQKFSLQDLIREVITETKGKSEEKGIQLLTDIKDSQVELETDKLRLKECIKNLVDNSIKYSPENKKVNLRAFNLSNEKIQFVVSDEGYGIPKGQQDKIFQKFFRAANVLTENFDGTGLGLYYVKKTIEELGGSISFESKVNNGTTFYLTIPKVYKEV